MPSNSDGRPLQGEVCERNSQGRSIGPRTARSTKASSRNALKRGFFAKELVIDPNDRGSKRILSKIFKGFSYEWNPIGASERLQVELLVMYAFRMRQLIKLRTAEARDRLLPDPNSDMYTDQLSAWSSSVNRLSKVRSTNSGIDQADEQVHEIHYEIDEIRVEHPPMNMWDKWQCHESHIQNNYYRALIRRYLLWGHLVFHIAEGKLQNELS